MKIFGVFLALTLVLTGCQINSIPTPDECLFSPSAPIEELVKDATIIYTAKVIKITKSLNEYTVHISVEQVYKGRVWDVGEVIILKINKVCAYPFELAHSYLFFDYAPIYDVENEQMDKVIELITDVDSN